MTSKGVQARSGARPFQVIPAIDLLGDEAVRLEQGDFSRISVRAGDPVELATRLGQASPPLLHVVDLEGARTGKIRPDVIGRIVAAAGNVPVQASGGVRTAADATRLLEAGASRVVVGTAAFSGRTALEHFVDVIGASLVVAVDIRNGFVAVAGWERSSELTVNEAVARCGEAGAPRLLCTAIDRDGTLAGPDFELLERVQQLSGVPVLAAGGVGSTEDLRKLEERGLEGAIVGRALLEGRIPLSFVAPGSA